MLHGTRVGFVRTEEQRRSGFVRINTQFHIRLPPPEADLDCRLRSSRNPMRIGFNCCHVRTILAHFPNVLSSKLLMVGGPLYLAR